MSFEFGEVHLKRNAQRVGTISSRDALARLEGRLARDPVDAGAARRPARRSTWMGARHARRWSTSWKMWSSTHRPERTSRSPRVSRRRGSTVTSMTPAPGLPPGQPERLFAKFQRRRERGRRRRGAGLGARHLKAIVKAHGGTSRPRSARGRGAIHVLAAHEVSATGSAGRRLNRGRAQRGCGAAPAPQSIPIITLDALTMA